jgi:putative FmdB family regulatory protein
MPTYSYLCCNCEHTFTNFTSISNRNISECPKCGNKSNTRLVDSGSGFIFKGEGFYATDKKNRELNISEGN